jgi:hypothetical protein
MTISSPVLSRSGRTVLGALMILVATGCASSQSALTPTPPKQINQLEMTQEEIRATQFTNMFDVIQALRGNWMRRKGDVSFTGEQTQIQVYLDTQRIGGVEELRTIAPVNVALVRYYDGAQASARWGINHGQGAIYILTRRR